MEFYSHRLETWTNQHSVQFPVSLGTNSSMENQATPLNKHLHKLCSPICVSLVIAGTTGNC